MGGVLDAVTTKDNEASSRTAATHFRSDLYDSRFRGSALPACYL
jgi:hypothetical protein